MAIVTSIYRCAQCGSKNVQAYDKEGKAVRPLANKDAAEFRCPDCGAVLDHAMDAAKKAELDAKELESVGTISGALNK